MKNNLEKVILDQHSRVKSAGEKGHEVLGEAKGAILSVATPEQVQQVLDKTLDIAMLTRRDPIGSHLRGVREPDSLPRRLAGIDGGLFELSRDSSKRSYRLPQEGLIVPGQGYVGLVALDAAGQAYDIFGFSAAHGQKLQEEDPIQEACGPDFFYPPMMWAKALYSEAYNNRSESQRKLPIHVWLAELVGEGLFQGSKPTQNGLLGATGFMPSAGQTGMKSKLNRSPKRKEHLASEEIKPFQASGLMDQAVLQHLTSSVGIDKTEVAYLAGQIISAGGSLN